MLKAMLKTSQERLTTRHQAFDGWLLLATLSLMLIGWVMARVLPSCR